MHRQLQTVRGAAGLEHQFWFDHTKSLRLNRSLGSNEFDAFCIRKLRQIGVYDFAPTFSTGHAYAEFFQPVEEYNYSYFGAFYSSPWSSIELNTRNSKIENLPAVRGTRHHELQDRCSHNGAEHRTRDTTSYLGHRCGNRAIAAAPSNDMTSAFRYDDACVLRISGRDCWLVSPSN